MTPERLRELVIYDPLTGEMRWRVSRSNAPEGELCGTPMRQGHLAVGIERRRYLLHRLAWLYIHGRWPVEQIDHINGDPQDNRLSNLREATHAQNLRNAHRRRDNTSGIKGVSWTGCRWRVRIKDGAKYLHVGCFATKEEAALAYEESAKKFYGEFARTA